MTTSHRKLKRDSCPHMSLERIGIFTLTNLSVAAFVVSSVLNVVMFVMVILHGFSPLNPYHKSRFEEISLRIVSASEKTTPYAYLLAVVVPIGEEEPSQIRVCHRHLVQSRYSSCVQTHRAGHVFVGYRKPSDNSLYSISFVDHEREAVEHHMIYAIVFSSLSVLCHLLRIIFFVGEKFQSGIAVSLYNLIPQTSVYKVSPSGKKSFSPELSELKKDKNYQLSLKLLHSYESKNLYEIAKGVANGWVKGLLNLTSRRNSEEIVWMDFQEINKKAFGNLTPLVVVPIACVIAIILGYSLGYVDGLLISLGVSQVVFHGFLMVFEIAESKELQPFIIPGCIVTDQRVIKYRKGLGHVSLNIFWLYDDLKKVSRSGDSVYLEAQSSNHSVTIICFDTESAKKLSDYTEIQIKDIPVIREKEAAPTAPEPSTPVPPQNPNASAFPDPKDKNQTAQKNAQNQQQPQSNNYPEMPPNYWVSNPPDYNQYHAAYNGQYLNYHPGQYPQQYPYFTGQNYQHPNASENYPTYFAPANNVGGNPEGNEGEGAVYYQHPPPPPGPPPPPNSFSHPQN